MSIRSRSLLFAGVASILLATISGHLYSIDGLQYFRAGERLLLDRSLSFDPPLIWGSPIQQPITPIGLSLVYIPALILALPLISRQPPFSSAPYDGLLLYHDPVYVAVSWVDPLLVALLAVLVACLGLRLGLDRRSSLLAAIASVFAGPLFFYARADFAQPLTTVLLVAAVLLALRARQDGSPGTGLMAFVIALGILTRPVDGALTVAAAAMPLLVPGGEWRWRDGLRVWVGIAAGAIVGLTLSFVVNDLRRGRPLDFGYGPVGFIGSLHLGLAMELISPGRGLMLYLPLALLAPIGAVILWRARRRLELVTLVVPTALWLLVYAKWSGFGAWSWGPRYLTPIVPFVVLLAASLLSFRGSRWPAATFVALAVAGVAENLAHIGVDQLAGFWGTYGDDIVGSAGFWRQFEPGAFAPLTSWGSFTGTPDVLWVKLAAASHGATALAACGMLVAGIALLALVLRSAATRGARGSPATLA